MRPEPYRKIVLVVLVVVVAVGAWLRVRGVSYGLPSVYNPDEIAILSRALGFAKGDLNPHNFLYPTFFFYLLFGWIGAFFVAARLLGTVPSLAAFQTSFFVDPSTIYVAGRSLGVVCGVAGIVATWWLARRLFGRGVALTAAWFLAVAPTAVLDAHYIKHDVPVTLAIVLAMIAIGRFWPERAGSSITGAVVAGGLCGVAFSTHYYAIFVAGPLALALWWDERGMPSAGRLLAWLAAGASAVFVFFALSPFLLVEPSRAWHDIVANRQIVVDRSGAGTGGLFANAAAYARMLWHDAMGWPVLLLGLIGAWSVLRLSRRVGTWLLAFPVLFLAFIANTVAASRYLNPVLPFLAMVGAVGVHDVVSRLVPRRRVVGAVMLSVAAAIPAFAASLRIGPFLLQDDTRSIARHYIETHVPPGSTVLVQPYSVQLVQSRDSLIEALRSRVGDPANASTKFQLRLQLDPWPAPAYRTLFLGEGGLDADKIYLSYRDFSTAAIADAALERFGIQYVVLKRYNVEDPVIRPVLDALARTGHRLVTISPYRPDTDPAVRARVAPFQHNTDTPIDSALERPGPIVELWAIR